MTTTQSTRKAARGSEKAGAPPQSPADTTTHDEATHVEALILGAGVCGVSALAGLVRSGIDNVVLIERSDAVGGTWHHNSYPGCAVDIPTHVYSFSWAPNPEWSRVFAPQKEIKDYLEKVVNDRALMPKIRLNTEVLEAAWDEDAQRWLVQTTDGQYSAKVFISAPGPLHEPLVPDIPGMESFTGQAFHSALWPAGIDLTGKKVVVLGTGPSALQFIPAIQPQVDHMTVIQRTPSWVMPKMDWKVTRLEKALMRRFPFLMRVTRLSMWAFMDAFFVLATMHPAFAKAMALFGRLHLRRYIKDRVTRKALTPSYAPTCKRLGLSNDFYRALAAPNVSLTTSLASAVHERSIVTADGTEIDADVIIFGTGFRTIQQHPINKLVKGRGGNSLDDIWQGNPTAYFGTTVAGFPNAFIMFGPNVGTLSGFVMAEAQTDYIVGAVHAMRREGFSSIDVRPEAQQAFVDECDEIFKTSTFVRGGCDSYYLDQKSGSRVTLVWPGSMAKLRKTVSVFDINPYSTQLATADSRPTTAVRLAPAVAAR
ncbi:flavin-containing monooxygenase [Hoyosella subflava]|nr:NAD(P)/FAD-dependent oxidoreductase [Hoyosella subflava]